MNADSHQDARYLLLINLNEAWTPPPILWYATDSKLHDARKDRQNYWTVTAKSKVTNWTVVTRKLLYKEVQQTQDASYVIDQIYSETVMTWTTVMTSNDGNDFNDGI